MKCWNGSGCRMLRDGGRINCRAASGSVARLRDRWSRCPPCFSSTSLLEGWMLRYEPSFTASSGRFEPTSEIPMLLVTHSLEECFELANEMFIFRDGRIVQSGPPSAVCGKPASLETARLLGIYNILPAEIRALDPARRTSILRIADEHDIEADYYPGHLKGDRVHLLATPRQLQAQPRSAHRMTMNSIPAELQSASDTPDGIRLEFAGGIQVEMPRSGHTQAREWVVTFPTTGLRIL